MRKSIQGVLTNTDIDGVYICGPEQMTLDIRDVMLEKRFPRIYSS